MTAFPDARINIDPKSDAVVDPLIEAVRAAAAVDRVCVGSFSDERLRRVREALGPDVALALGPRAITRFVLRSLRVPVGHERAACLQLPLRWNGLPLITDRLLERAHRLGMHVHVWTINDPDQMRELLDRGVDGIMTDRPAVLKSVLVERDQWVEP